MESGSWSKPYHDSLPYLVKNGESSSFYVTPKSFEEALVQKYSKDELKEIHNQLLSLSSSKNANCFIVACHKHWYRSVKLFLIETHVNAAISQYDSFAYNKFSIAAEQKKCNNVEKFYL